MKQEEYLSTVMQQLVAIAVVSSSTVAFGSRVNSIRHLGQEGSSPLTSRKPAYEQV